MSTEPMDAKGLAGEEGSVSRSCPVGPLDRAATGNVELFADFDGGLRDDLQYLSAALSYYWGGPADSDVRGAWERVTQCLRDLRADYLRLLHEKVDGLFGPHAVPMTTASAGGGPTQPSTTDGDAVPGTDPIQTAASDPVEQEQGGSPI